MSPAFAISAVLATAPAVSSSPALQVGQTRSCLSDGDGKQLFVTVGRIEAFDRDHKVVSVSLFNEAPGSSPPGVAHLPIDADILQASCPAIAIRSLPLSPQFEEGYATWKGAAHGGAFTVTVEQIYDMAATTLAKARVRGADVH